LVSTLKNALLVFGVALLVSAACIGSAKATTTTLSVADGMDDAYHNCFGTFDNSSTTVTVARGVSNYSSAGFRFNNTIVPKGATINSATFYVKSAVSGNLYCQIHAEATDYSSNYDIEVNGGIPDVLSRARTTAFTTVGASITTGYKSYSVTAVIQELVYRSGWSTYNSFSILMIGDTSGTSQFSYFSSYESGSANAAYITIDWSPGATVLNQAHYRWRNDDGWEKSSTGTVGGQ
jgi:hypothetical protein